MVRQNPFNPSSSWNPLSWSLFLTLFHKKEIVGSNSLMTPQWFPPHFVQEQTRVNAERNQCSLGLLKNHCWKCQMSEREKYNLLTMQPVHWYNHSGIINLWDEWRQHLFHTLTALNVFVLTQSNLAYFDTLASMDDKAKHSCHESS